MDAIFLAGVPWRKDMTCRLHRRTSAGPVIRSLGSKTSSDGLAGDAVFLGGENCIMTTARQRYELVEGTSAKFWEIERDGASVTVRYGRLGSSAVEKTKTHASVAAAEKEERTLVADKTKKGYGRVDAVAGDPAPAGGKPLGPAKPRAVKISREFMGDSFLWSPDAKHLLVFGSGSYAPLLLTIGESSAHEQHFDPEVPTNNIAWGADSQHLYSLTPGAIVEVGVDGKERGRIAIPKSVESYAVRPGGGFAFGSKKDGVVLHDGAGKRMGIVSKKPYWVVSFDPSGALLLLGDGDDRLVVDLDGNILAKFLKDEYAWNGPRELLLIASGESFGVAEGWWGMARVRIGYAPNELHVEYLFEPDTRHFDATPHGHFAAFLISDKASIEIYDLTTKKRIARHRVPGTPSDMACAFAPDGRFVAAMNWQKKVHLYEPPVAGLDADESDTAAPQDSERLEAVQRIRRFAPELPKIALLPNGTTLRGIAAPPETVKDTPTCPCCEKPMSCIVSLDFASLNPKSEVGNDGILQVFYCTSTSPPCEVKTEAWAAGPGKSKLVRVVRGSDNSHCAKIGWSGFADVPMADDTTVEKKLPSIARKAELEDDWPAPFTGDKIGGYPAWAQDAEYPDCPHCKAPATDLVMQLASEGISGVQFGDMGTAYVFRCKKHPTVLDLIWQSG